VTYYLPEAAVLQMLDSLICRCAPGSALVFDYSLRRFVEGDESTYGGKIMQRWLKKNNERFHFGLDEGELPAYLKRFNLTVDEDLGPAELGPRYLTAADRRSLGEPLGHLRLAHATLQPASQPLSTGGQP
jgi:O-methyltransferase involved in polyketide biosynthesis